MAQTEDNFWSTTSHYDPVTRRILFPFGHKTGEIVISIAPDQPVWDLAMMSETVFHQAIVDARTLQAHDTITPTLVFSAITNPHQGLTPVAVTATHRELPVWQLIDKTHTKIDEMSFQAAMKKAHAAMLTAAVATGDHAVGFLVREEVLHFYPLLAVNIPEDIASYKEGSGTTNDVIPQLPFQS